MWQNGQPIIFLDVCLWAPAICYYIYPGSGVSIPPPCFWYFSHILQKPYSCTIFLLRGGVSKMPFFSVWGVQKMPFFGMRGAKKVEELEIQWKSWKLSQVFHCTSWKFAPYYALLCKVNLYHWKMRFLLKHPQGICELMTKTPCFYLSPFFCTIKLNAGHL